MINSFIAIFALSTFVEGFVEYFVSDPNQSQPWLKYVAAMVGIVVSFFYRLDLFALLGISASYQIVGYVVTGLIIGRGSNYLNQIISSINKMPAPAVSVTQANTTTTVSSQ